VTNLDDVVLKPLQLAYERTLEKWPRGSLECCNQSLNGNSLRAQEIKRNVDNEEDQAHEVSDGSKDSIGKLTRGHLCYKAKNLTTFCP
jgi:hypothetical protein